MGNYKSHDESILEHLANIVYDDLQRPKFIELQTFLPKIKKFINMELIIIQIIIKLPL